jgi:thiol-disulfide isomerase/thioredoxin
MRSVLIGVLALAAAAGGSPRDEYEGLVKEYNAKRESGTRPAAEEFAPRFFALAEKHRDDPAAVDALVWVASTYIFGPETEKALVTLARDYSRSERLKAYYAQSSRYGEPFWPYEELLRAVLKGNLDREARATAVAALAEYLKMAKERSESCEIRFAFRGRGGLSPGSLANLDRIKERGLDKVKAESEALFQEVMDRYADVRLPDHFPPQAGEFARGQLFELRSLAIGQTAPEIEGKDLAGRPMRLNDYRGKVVVLDFGSHRSCGVCRAMYPQLRQLAERFAGRPFALLGIDVDDELEEIRDVAKAGEITWPVWYDGEGAEGPIATRWVIRSMPTIYVLDARGVIRNRGFLQGDDLIGTVEMLLKEMEAAKP